MSSPRQHTPGPWTASAPDHESMPANRCGGCDIAILAPSGCYGIATPGVMTLATVYDSEANARLIAASPELLAALEDMTDRYARAMKDSGVSHYPEAMVEIRSARAAIARATGGNAL